MAGRIVSLGGESISSVKKPVKLSLALDASQKAFSKKGVAGEIDAYDLYIKERDGSREYRMIFMVNVLASNILYNKCTEFIYDENGENQLELRQATDAQIKNVQNSLGAINTTELNWKQAIRDTEYSFPVTGGIKYHYGLDIFNNHMLRSKDFVFIGQIARNDTQSSSVFNTLSDYMRTEDGDMLQVNSGYDNALINAHVYQSDTVYSMAEAVKSRLVGKNGWWGFYNPSNIKIPNYKGKAMSTLDGSVPSCSFIQLYPDSSLYSFVPIKNTKKRRQELNWDYTMAYPYKNRFDIFNKINTCPEQINGIKVLSCVQFKGENGIEQVVFRTKLKHNLSAGDSVSIYYSTAESTNKVPVSITVKSVGDVNGKNVEYCFVAEAERLKYLVDKFFVAQQKITYSVAEQSSITGMFVVKIINGCECRYYVREFRKLYLADSKGRSADYNSDIMRMAYATNIYSDGIAQLIFNDKISIDGIKDNLHRDISELALIMVKTNRGHNEWYIDNDFASDKIEASHCFGEISSGLNLPKTDLDDNYNVRMLYNVEIPQNDKRYYEAIASPDPIESNITIDRDTYYVDIVEFNVGECRETVIEDIYHRFNTMQRELPEGNKFNCVLNDEIVRDDYDFEKGGFETKEVPINELGFTDNISLEGYYYSPAYKFDIRQISDNTTEYSARRRNYVFTTETFKEFEEDGIRKSSLNIDVAYSKEDIFAVLVNVLTQEKIFGYIKGSKIIAGEDVIGVSLKDYVLTTTDCAIPAGASYNLATRKFVGRKILDYSELSNSNDLSSTPFANGCHYIEKNIDLYVRRQDPFGYYKLSSNASEGLVLAAENKFYTDFSRLGDKYESPINNITVTSRSWSDCVSGPEMNDVLGEMANVSTTLTENIMEEL